MFARPFHPANSLLNFLLHSPHPRGPFRLLSAQPALERGVEQRDDSVVSPYRAEAQSAQRSQPIRIPITFVETPSPSTPEPKRARGPLVEEPEETPEEEEEANLRRAIAESLQPAAPGTPTRSLTAAATAPASPAGANGVQPQRPHVPSASPPSSEDTELAEAIKLSLVEEQKKAQQSAAAHEELERMRNLLQLYGFEERPITGDGNCLFRAVSDQLWGTQERHAELRTESVAWLRCHGDMDIGGARLSDFQEAGAPSWEAYLQNLSQDGSWGDHLALLALAESRRLRITLISSCASAAANPLLTVEPRNADAELRPVYLAHWHERHYSSLQPANSEDTASGDESTA